MAMVGHESENEALLAEVERADVNEKGFVPDELRTQIFRKLRARQENRTCFDCPARNPTWISLSHGCYVCLVCSGEHRRMGVHISFVRSVELDSFNKEQLVQMIVGGNSKARAYLKSIGIEGKRKDTDSAGGRKCDYGDKSCLKYRQELEKNTHAQCRALGIHVSGGSAASSAAAGASSSSRQPASDPFANGGGNSMPFAAAPGSGDAFGAQAGVYQKLEVGTNGGGSSNGAAGGMVSNGTTSTSHAAEDLASELFKDFKSFQNPTPVAAPAPTSDIMSNGRGGAIFGGGSASPNRPHSNSNDGPIFGAGFSSGPSSTSTHFASSSGNVPKAAKATELVDDFDFDFFEQEATRVVEPVATSSRPVEGSYGLPDNSPAEQSAPSLTAPIPGSAEQHNTPIFGFGPPPTSSGSGFGSQPSSFTQPAASINNNLQAKKAFGSADVFANASANSGPALDPNLRGKTAFGSDALFGRQDSGSSDGGGQANQLYNKAVEKGHEYARQGAEKLRGVLDNYLKR